MYQWNADTSKNNDDSFLVLITSVPLRLLSDNYIFLWRNQSPSSTSFCRPIKLLFKKETENVVGEEVSTILEQINQLTPTAVCVDRHKFEVFHALPRDWWENRENYFGNTNNKYFDL